MNALIPPNELIAELRGAQRVLIVSHANPDGDAIGSESALARILIGLGKDVLIWNHDPTPDLYAPCLEGLPVHIGEHPPPGHEHLAGSFDLVFFVECPTIQRTGHRDVFGELAKVNVDHHLGNGEYGDHNWVLPKIASVSILIFQIARALEAEISQPVADALLLGLVTDTGGFRFSNTTSDALRAAAEMVDFGASPERVSKQLYESRSEASLRLLALVLGSLERHADGEIATVLLTEAMLGKANATYQDGESLVDYPRSIAGVEIAALFREIGVDHYKVSLRSRGEVSVESVARRNGGGGHRNAAGCELKGPIEEVRSQLVAQLEGALESGSERSRGKPLDSSSTPASGRTA